MRGLEGQVAIVTGGARGIGAAIVQRLIAEGAKVAAFDLIAEPAAEGAWAYVVDITDIAAVRAAVAAVEADLGPIDILINNAGRNRAAAPFVTTGPADWQEMIAANLVGPLNMHHAVLQGMAERGRGRIVNVASDAGRLGAPNEAVYSACKGGVIALTKALARETAKAQITVNVVCPGPTETQLFRDVAGEGEGADRFRARLAGAIPLGRMGTPDDVVGAVCFLASADAAFITGQVLSVSGGLAMVG